MKNTNLKIDYTDLYEISNRYYLSINSHDYYFATLKEVLEQLKESKVIKDYQFEEIIVASFKNAGKDYFQMKDDLDDLYNDTYKTDRYNEYLEESIKFNELLKELTSDENLAKAFIFGNKINPDYYYYDLKEEWELFLNSIIEEVESSYFTIDSVDHCVERELEARGFEYNCNNLFNENEDMFDVDTKVKEVILTLADKVESGEIE
jgi:predicted metal-dependent hydrolase